MSDEEEQETDPPSVVLASLADLASADIAAALDGLDHADDHALERALDHAAKEAEARGASPAQRGYGLLSILCTLHLRVEDQAAVWGPRWQGPEGRSYTASDFRGEQTAILAEMAGAITHPALRARVADVVWHNDRARRAAANLAVEAYCELIERRLDGSYVRRFSPDSILDLVDWFHRALQIVALSRKRGEMPEAPRRVFESLYAQADPAGQYVAFTKLARLGVEYGLTEWAKVAPDAERLADRRGGGDYPMAVQGVWDLAAQGYAKLGDDEAQRRCQERSVDETLRMREQVGSAAAQAYWTRKAIGELRAARGFKDRIAKLRAELREFQDASLDEFGQFSIPMDLTKERQGTIELFDGLTLPDILLQFALLSTSPKVEELRRQALESRKSSFFGSLFGASYSDHEGKTVAETRATPLEGEPDEAWFKEQSLQYLDLWRHQIVGGFIEPARRTVMLRFPLEERHFGPIASMSPFVPPGHEHLFALGLARFWQGDYASAAHLLIPQLENSLRYVLLNANRESSKMKPNLLQEDRSLSGLLQWLRPELAEIFGADLVNEIDLLFNHRPGPALRHDLAHGKMSVGACYDPTAIYACWLIYQLMCLPLVRHWKDRVAPALERAAI
ncbi:DUF4209 domain-containing protein [Sphingomonas sp. NPDC079357]|uniref:DUF4209 domain-containing protein n=1 Tax=Sphingomonas sp. NPDC079357 TaxID=3364518 RepID=UPI00384F4AC5